MRRRGDPLDDFDSDDEWSYQKNGLDIALFYNSN